MLPLLHILLLATSGHLPLISSTDPTLNRPPTIPASREQPGSTDSCPLNLPDDFFRGVSAACSLATTDLCCPALAAWLLTAYSAEALATRVQPSAERSDDELPVLPGDTEPCTAAAEAALRARGVEIQGANDTCGAASCACGVRLHPLQCSGPFVVGGGGEGRWVPVDDVAKSLEFGCERPGLGGCTTCLRVLYELKNKDEEKGSINGEDVKGGRECQLMGLTWLLSKNRTRYLPTATYVLRAFRKATDSYPATCVVAGDGANDMPLPVGSDQLLGTASSTASREWSPPTSPFIFFLLVINFFLK
ncbi:hypothetical protein KFK09_008818 [Dendrobium nobile]|uniref:SPARK domain-containing protein n=1 Tax=Dendrobium nobile TaxID=94219 RepID=A0A8T3BQM0_DENNO|nr:hypothetical protein KFK09_008818 [Dendrobium nobile]